MLSFVASSYDGADGGGDKGGDDKPNLGPGKDTPADDVDMIPGT